MNYINKNNTHNNNDCKDFFKPKQLQTVSYHALRVVFVVQLLFLLKSKSCVHISLLPLGES